PRPGQRNELEHVDRVLAEYHDPRETGSVADTWCAPRLRQSQDGDACLPVRARANGTPALCPVWTKRRSEATSRRRSSLAREAGVQRQTTAFHAKQHSSGGIQGGCSHPGGVSP